MQCSLTSCFSHGYSSSSHLGWLGSAGCAIRHAGENISQGENILQGRISRRGSYFPPSHIQPFFAPLYTAPDPQLLQKFAILFLILFPSEHISGQCVDGCEVWRPLFQLWWISEFIEKQTANVCQKMLKPENIYLIAAQWAENIRDFFQHFPSAEPSE